MADEGAPAPPLQAGTQEGELARLRAELKEVNDEKKEVKESIREDKTWIKAGNLSDKERESLREAIAADKKRLATLEDRVSEIRKEIKQLTNPPAGIDPAGASCPSRHSPYAACSASLFASHSFLRTVLHPVRTPLHGLFPE